MPIYFHYAWPAFLALGAVIGYVLVRLIAPLPVALLSVVLIVAGSDFSYLAAWFLPHDNVDWDYVLWPTNFLSPTMHVLHFNTWGPACRCSSPGCSPSCAGCRPDRAAGSCWARS